MLFYTESLYRKSVKLFELKYEVDPEWVAEPSFSFQKTREDYVTKSNKTSKKLILELISGKNKDIFMRKMDKGNIYMAPEWYIASE